MKYEPALDGLRAVAVVMVVLFHAFPDQFPGGWMGVDIFFVLSGYLITTILAKELRSNGNISFLTFYARRSLRLLPAAGLLFGFELARALFSHGHRAEIIQATLVSIFYFMNWNRAFDVFPQDILGHMWSLSMEEQFYLVWPAILSLIFMKRPRIWIVALITSVVIWRAILIFEGASVNRTYNGFDTHSDALLIGCLLAFSSDAVRLRLGKMCWLGLGLFGISLFVVPHDLQIVQLVGLTLLSGLAACMIIGAGTSNYFSRLLSLPPLLFTGRISYGWYLWHYPLIVLATFYVKETMRIPAMMGAIATSYLIATASYFLVEKRFLRIKKHFSTEPTLSAGKAAALG